MSDMVRMVHPGIDGSETFVPDDEAALAHHEARGWEKQPKPEAEHLPFVPRPPDAPPEDQWVVLRHPDIAGTNTVPNDPAALAEAFDKGWTEDAPLPAAPPKPAKAKAKAPESPAPADAPSSTDNPKE